MTEYRIDNSQEIKFYIPHERCGEEFVLQNCKVTIEKCPHEKKIKDLEDCIKELLIVCSDNSKEMNYD